MINEFMIKNKQPKTQSIIQGFVTYQLANHVSALFFLHIFSSHNDDPKILAAGRVLYAALGLLFIFVSICLVNFLYKELQN
jgi:hypothetical protein